MLLHGLLLHNYCVVHVASKSIEPLKSFEEVNALAGSDILETDLKRPTYHYDGDLWC